MIGFYYYLGITINWDWLRFTEEDYYSKVNIDLRALFYRGVNIYLEGWISNRVNAGFIALLEANIKIYRDYKELKLKLEV